MCYIISNKSNNQYVKYDVGKREYSITGHLEFAECFENKQDACNAKEKFIKNKKKEFKRLYEVIEMPDDMCISTNVEEKFIFETNEFSWDESAKQITYISKLLDQMNDYKDKIKANLSMIQCEIDEIMHRKENEVTNHIEVINELRIARDKALDYLRVERRKLKNELDRIDCLTYENIKQNKLVKVLDNQTNWVYNNKMKNDVDKLINTYMEVK